MSTSGRKRLLRIGALILAAALCLGLAACGGHEDVPETEKTPETEAAPEAEKEPAPEEEQEEEPEEEEEPEDDLVGQRYSDFTGQLLGGGEFTLSEHEGKVILLNFWASWCGPCVREMPAFPRLIEKYGDSLALVAVDLDEDAQTVADFIEENGYDFPVVLDTDGAIGQLYPTMAIPYTVIIAPDGTIAATSLGANGADEMFEHYSEAIDAALGQE